MSVVIIAMDKNLYMKMISEGKKIVLTNVLLVFNSFQILIIKYVFKNVQLIKNIIMHLLKLIIIIILAQIQIIAKAATQFIVKVIAILKINA